MHKEYDNRGSEYSMPASEEVLFEKTDTSSEYSAPAKEYFDYPDEHLQSSSDSSSRQTKKPHKSSKRKLVYLTASAVASVMLFSASFGSGILAPNGSILDRPIVEAPLPDIEIPSESEQPSIPDNTTQLPIPSESETITESEEPSEPESTIPPESLWAGQIIYTGNQFYASGNYLLAGSNANGNVIANYDNEVLCQFEANVDETHGPNEMGYTFFVCDKFTNLNIRAYDYQGELVNTFTPGSDLRYYSFGDSDIMTFYFYDQEINASYVQYMRADGTILFDSRKYTSLDCSATTFNNGFGLISMPSGREYDPLNPKTTLDLWMIDYEGNIKKTAHPDMQGSFSEMDLLDGYTYASGGEGFSDTPDTHCVYYYDGSSNMLNYNTGCNLYALVTVGTGEMTNYLYVEEVKKQLGVNHFELSSFFDNGIGYQHVGTYGVINDKYLFNFNDVDSKTGLPSKYLAEYDHIYLNHGPNLLVFDEETGYYYIDFEGNVLGGPYPSATPFTKDGYAMVANDYMYCSIIDANCNVVETIEAAFAHPVEYFSLGNVFSIFPGHERVFYYYGGQTEPNSLPTFPTNLFADSSGVTVEPPVVDKPTLYSVSKKDKLKTFSTQLKALSQALSLESNDFIEGRGETIASLKRLLKSAEAVYYVVSTDNATMTSFETLENNQSLTGVGLAYISDINQLYSEKQTFDSLVSLYLDYHTSSGHKNLNVIAKELAFLEGRELTNLQTYSLAVAGELVQAFYDNRGGYETMFNNMTAYYNTIRSLDKDQRFKESYEKCEPDLVAYFEIIKEVPNWEFPKR